MLLLYCDTTESAVNIKQIKYLNNIALQDHRFIKRIIRPMLGFKNFHCAKMILSGIEIMRMIKKEAATLPGQDHFVSSSTILFACRLNKVFSINPLAYNLTATEP